MTRKPRLSAAVPLLLWLWTTWQAAAAIQLDVFAGYDGKVHAGSWFPVAIEVFNDGATLEGSFEVLGGRFGNQEQRFKEQLPGGTRKRFLMTVFAGSLNSAEVTVRLADARGKTIAERQQPLLVVAADVPLLGAIAEGVSGMPRFPEQQDQQPERIPSVGRLETAYLPDNAVANSNLGNALRDAGRLPEALASYERALKLAPASSDALANYALALVAAGRPAEALARFAEAARSAPRKRPIAISRGAAVRPMMSAASSAV
jgi:tetratricopeptide (TPR) repeat protein